MRIAVVIPSRLQPNPLGMNGRLYLDRAIDSVRAQTVYGQHDVRIAVGLSPGAPILTGWLGIEAVTASRDGQSAALNAAVKAAGDFDLLAFLEDDDTWDPRKLEYQLAAIEQGFQLVTCTQREVTPEGDFIRYNDFPTMSGWLMTKEAWEKTGNFDETFQWHMDNEWLGRFNEAGRCSDWKRLHMAENGADKNPRPWLRNVAQFSTLATIPEREPLVNRTVNPKGGMHRIATDPLANAESRTEHARLVQKFSRVPW